ncbi:O-antigen polymerase [Pantoea sp. B65]|uniref:O-antigen polymerase n=1 Tax=Pantoea sp. B65 TaxID=2813359 RepID=UPI0039B4FA7A
MIAICSLLIMLIISFAVYRYYADITHPAVLFSFVWLAVMFFNVTLAGYIQTSDSAMCFVLSMILLFLAASVMTKNIRIKVKYRPISYRIVKALFIITFVIQTLAVLIMLREYLASGKSLVEFIANLRAVQMYPDDNSYPGLLSNFIIMRVIKNNYLFNYILLVTFALLSDKKKMIASNLLVRLIFATLMGSRWQGVVDILSLSFIFIDRSKDSFKFIFKYGFLFIVFFMLAGMIRSESGFSFQYFLMYIFGGLPAFSVFYNNPDFIYLPKTFVYIEQMLGMASDGAFNIVADSIFLTPEIKTNTYTIFGVLYKYFGTFGSACYFIAFGAMMSFLYKYRFRNILLSVLYYISIPSVFLSVFTEATLSLAPIYVRTIFVILIIQLVFKVKHAPSAVSNNSGL